MFENIVNNLKSFSYCDTIFCSRYCVKKRHCVHLENLWIGKDHKNVVGEKLYSEKTVMKIFFVQLADTL